MTRALVSLGLCALVLAGCATHKGSGGGPSATLSSYLHDWAARDYPAMAGLVDRPPRDFASDNAKALSSLDARAASYDAGAISTHGSSATAKVTEHIDLALYSKWTVHTTVRLRLVRGHWRVLWSPATINPAFGSNGSYAVSYSWPARADILASNGTAISAAPPSSVVIGLEGRYLKDASKVEADLVAAGATRAQAAAAATAAQASPTAFEPVFTVTYARYQQLEPSLEPVPGIFFQGQGGGGSTPSDLVDVVGALGTITKAELKQLGPPYDSTSTVGVGGLEQAYQRQLAGTPGATISTSPSGRVLARFKASSGTPVRTTIDLSVENDAASALAGAPGQESALVAIEASTGKILAVVDSSQGSDLALEGQQPPGSTMKVITSTALIDDGLTPQSPATCPPTRDVDGEIFHNAGGEGYVPNLLQAFTVSCNTAFIGLAMANLNYHALHDAALEYRIGTTLSVGIPVFAGSVPVNDGQTDLAASAIGQARVVLNPLDLAMVAADIDTSTVRTPWIAQGAPAEHQKTKALPSDLVSDLHQMMLSVVESGTASGTGLPAGTYAKTGTAEYGSGNPLPLDGWLMGFNGNIAFCMVDVDSPGDGGPVDGPIVAKFLDSLGAGQ